MISVCFVTLFCPACNTGPENWHICVIKGLTYLLKKTLQGKTTTLFNKPCAIQTWLPTKKSAGGGVCTVRFASLLKTRRRFGYWRPTEWDRRIIIKQESKGRAEQAKVLIDATDIRVNSGNPVFFQRDYHPKERQKMRELRTELLLRQKRGEKLMAKL